MIPQLPDEHEKALIATFSDSMHRRGFGMGGKCRIEFADGLMKVTGRRGRDDGSGACIQACCLTVSSSCCLLLVSSLIAAALMEWLHIKKTSIKLELSRIDSVRRRGNQFSLELYDAERGACTTNISLSSREDAARFESNLSAAGVKVTNY